MTSPVQKLKRAVEDLPETWGQVVARVPFFLRFGPSYVRMQRAIAHHERTGRVPSSHQRLRALRRLVAGAAQHNPFYRDFYRERGFSIGALRTLDDWRRVPIVTKADLQAVPLAARTTTTAGTGIRVNTGGTSGEPLELLVDANAFASEWAHLHALWGAKGYHWRAVKLTFRGKHFEAPQPLRFNALHNEYVVNASCPMDEVVDAVVARCERTVIRWIHGYPSLVAEFSHELERRGALERGAVQSRLFGVLLGSEFPAPAYRTVIERVLSPHVVSWYGHSEMAVLAKETALGVYECMPTYGYAEAVPADPGGPHRLVCTALYNRVHPLIRYDTGDLIEPVSTRAGALSFRVSEGRVGEFVCDRAGRRHSLTALIFGRHHAAFELLRHVQVRDNGDGRVSLVVTPRDPATSAGLLRPLFDLSNVDIDWTVEVVDTPIRTPAGKIRLLIP